MPFRSISNKHFAVLECKTFLVKVAWHYTLKTHLHFRNYFWDRQYLFFNFWIAEGTAILDINYVCYHPHHEYIQPCIPAWKTSVRLRNNGFFEKLHALLFFSYILRTNKPTFFTEARVSFCSDEHLNMYFDIYFFWSMQLIAKVLNVYIISNDSHLERNTALKRTVY